MGNHQDGIWIIDADARTIYANECIAEILGTSPAEMIGQPSFAYLLPEDVEAAQRLSDMKKGGSAKPFRFRVAPKGRHASLGRGARNSDAQRGWRIPGDRRHV